MISRSYRTYAVKEGETIDTIIESRRISMEEVDKLNPGSDLDNLAPREIIKLPAHRYSAHEEYESHGLLGNRILKPGGWFANTLIAGCPLPPSDPPPRSPNEAISVSSLPCVLQQGMTTRLAAKQYMLQSNMNKLSVAEIDF